MATPRVLPVGGGRELNIVGDKISIKLTGHETGGAYCSVEEASPPQGGPPLHLHHREDESFYVLEGDYEFQIGDRQFRVDPGAFLFGPRGTPHAFKNVGTKMGRVLVVVSPPGLEKFFEEADQLGRAGPPPVEKLIELASKYELEFLPPRK